MHLTADDLVALLESDLAASGWDGSTVLDSGRSVLQSAMTSLRNSLVKKFHNGTLTTELERLTLDSFIESNAKCGRFVSIPHRDGLQEWDLLIYGQVCEEMYYFLHKLDPVTGFDFPILTFNSILPGLDVGPGSSIGCAETDFFTKLCQSPMTYSTDSLVGDFTSALRSWPLWSSTESVRSSQYGYDKVVGSRLSFVPKSTKIARNICTEPLLNMIFQKGCANVLEERLASYFGISLKTQQGYNAHLAQLGSMTGGFATIDLKNASDTIAYGLVKDLFDPVNFRWLDKSRSSHTVFPDGTIVKLDMVSSMGNAFTFPLQTLIFACIVRAVYRLQGIQPVPAGRAGPGNYGVFGDDIVVDSRVYDLVCSTLQLFGFTVNSDKSFSKGDFRESCGHDYYQGCEIRGVYLQKLLQESDYYSAINRLMRWSIRWVHLTNLLKFLRKQVEFLPVPPDLSDIAGIKVPSSMAPFFARGKLADKAKRLGRVGIKIYRFHSARPRTRDLTSLGSAGSYPDGLLLTLVAGRLMGGRVGLRTNQLKTVKTVGVTPRWDYYPLMGGLLPSHVPWEWNSYWSQLGN